MKEKLNSLFNKKWTFSQSNRFKDIIRSFSLAEHVIFTALTTVFIVSALVLLYQVNAHFLVSEPTRGGTLTEGIVGSPRFVNPVIATSGADMDLVTLIYSGLVKQDATGNIVPDLAESYTISKDGLTYTFILNPLAKFSDGTSVTADDVIFTVGKVQDATVKSPLAAAWNGVRVSSPDAHTVVVTLSQPYGPFIYTMTLGILEKHIWAAVTPESFPFSQFNIQPIGSGPYTVSKVVTDTSGLPIEYDLDANTSYLHEPYISHMILKFYTTETDMITAYNKGDIDAMSSVSPKNMNLIKRTDGVVQTAPLSRVFGVFWNQSNAPVLLDPAVRQALDMAIDKQSLIDTVLLGYGVPLSGPLASDVATDMTITAPILHTQVNSHTSTSTSQGTVAPSARIAAARLVLEEAGWTIGSDGVYQKVMKDSKTGKTTTERLSFSLTTSDAPELKALAEQIQEVWDTLGAQVNVKIYQIGDLNQTIIEPRDYDALLFGEIVAPGLDLYPFWDSAQRNSPGLNIALYTNLKADKILQQMRMTTDQSVVASLEKQFETEVTADRPAIFLYAPDFIYIVPKAVQDIDLGVMTNASDQFNTVKSWYMETTSVWKIFSPPSQSSSEIQ